MAEETKTTEPEVKVEEAAFTKKQIVKSRKYARWVDWFNANLSDKQKYTHAELATMLKKHFKVTIK